MGSRVCGNDAVESAANAWLRFFHALPPGKSAAEFPVFSHVLTPSCGQPLMEAVGNIPLAVNFAVKDGSGQLLGIRVAV